MGDRPFGVLVLGALAIAIAVVRLVIGFQLLFGGIFSDKLEGSGIFWTGLLTLVVGIIYLAVGLGPLVDAALGPHLHHDHGRLRPRGRHVRDGSPRSNIAYGAGGRPYPGLPALVLQPRGHPRRLRDGGLGSHVGSAARPGRPRSSGGQDRPPCRQVPHRPLHGREGSMTRTIVCFGDSNTHGAHPDPAIGGRHPRDVRWPGVMRGALGEGYEVIEEGLNGRCTVWDTPIEPGRNGSTYLAPCLLSHRPVDLVIIMLGTNDVKRIYGKTASEIACGAGALVDVAKGTLCGPDGAPPRVLLVAPVPVGEVTAHSEMWGFGAARRGVAAAGRHVPSSWPTGSGVGFFDAGSVAQVSPLDGVHLDASRACRAGGRHGRGRARGAGARG